MKIFILFLFLILGNCTTTSAGISTSNIPVSNKRYQVLGPVSGQKGWVAFDIGIIGVPLSEPPIHALADSLIAEKEADALINIRYWNDRMIFLFITYHRIGMNAEAIKFEEGPLPGKR
jgi:hypothetical protein